MKIFVLFLSLISLSAQAEFLNELCQKSPFAVQYQENLIANGKTIWNAEGSVLYKDEEGFLAFTPETNAFWLLKQDVLQEVNTTGEVVTEITLPELSVMGWGQNLFRSGDEIYIVRGSGLSLFNLKTKTFSWSTRLHEMGANPISGATDGSTLYILYGTTMEDGFTGISMLNKQGEEINKLPLNRLRSGVFASGAVARWFQDRLIISNGGWMSSFDQNQLTGKKALVQKLIPTYLQMPEGKKQVMMKGDFFLTDKTLSGCGGYNQVIDGMGKIVNDYFSFNL